MQLTPQQMVQLQAKGLSTQQIQSIAQQKGYSVPQAPDLLQKTTDIVNRIFPGGKLGQAYGTQIGLGLTKLGDALHGTNTSKYYDRSQPNNFQLAGDVAQAGATAYGAAMPIASSILGKTAQFGALGAVSGAASGIAEGKPLSQVAGQTVRQGAIGALTGATFGVLEKGTKALTSGIGKVGEKIQTGVIRPSQADIADGFSVNTLRKYNLGGSLQDTLNKSDAQLDDLSQQLNMKLAESNASINLNKVFENTNKRLFGNKFSGFGSNAQLSTAAQKLQDEIAYSAGPNGLVSIPEAQVIKRSAGHFGAWQYGYQDPEAKASERVYNTFYNELKTQIEKSSPTGVKEINQKMSEIIPVVNAVIRRIPVAERNRGLSFQDIVTLTGAVLNPKALAVTGLSFAQKSGKVGNVLSKAPQVGNAIAKGIGGIEQAAQGLFPSTR